MEVPERASLFLSVFVDKYDLCAIIVEMDEMYIVGNTYGVVFL